MGHDRVDDNKFNDFVQDVAYRATNYDAADIGFDEVLHSKVFQRDVLTDLGPHLCPSWDPEYALWATPLLCLAAPLPVATNLRPAAELCAAAARAPRASDRARHCIVNAWEISSSARLWSTLQYLVLLSSRRVVPLLDFFSPSLDTRPPWLFEFFDAPPADLYRFGRRTETAVPLGIGPTHQYPRRIWIQSPRS